MSKKKRNKRANGEGSIVNRSDGRWEGRYSLGFDPETGKQIRPLRRALGGPLFPRL